MGVRSNRNHFRGYFLRSMGLCEAGSPGKLRENSRALLVSGCAIDAQCEAAFFESVIPNYSSYYPSTVFRKGHWYGWVVETQFLVRRLTRCYRLSLRSSGGGVSSWARSLRQSGSSRLVVVIPTSTATVPGPVRQQSQDHRSS